MSHTKRFYNNPKQRILFEWTRDFGYIPYWHPYKEIWSNWVWDGQLMSKRRRAISKIEIKRELKNLCPFVSVISDGECYDCWMREYDNDCDAMNEVVLYSFKEQYPWKWW